MAHSQKISRQSIALRSSYSLAPELVKNSKRQLRESIRYNVGELKEVVGMAILVVKEDIRLEKLLCILLEIYMFMSARKEKLSIQKMFHYPLGIQKTEVNG